MSREIALRIARRRQALRGTADDAEAARRTDAFKWAWSAIDGWGHVDADGKFTKTWNWSERIDRAQQLATYAVAAPLWSPPRKRWPAAEQGA
jgi:hypothetical protein